MACSWTVIDSGTATGFSSPSTSARPWCSRDSSIDIGLPLWPAKLLVPLAFGIMALRLVLQLWGYGRAVVKGLERPVAVPLVKSAAELAAEEAEHVSALNR